VTRPSRRPDFNRQADIGRSTAEWLTWRDKTRFPCGRAAVWIFETSAQNGRSVRQASGRATAKPQPQRVTGAVGAVWRVLAKATSQAAAKLADALLAKWRRRYRFAAAAGVGLAPLSPAIGGAGWTQRRRAGSWSWPSRSP
jgi:hypothetical protein